MWLLNPPIFWGVKHFFFVLCCQRVSGVRCSLPTLYKRPRRLVSVILRGRYPFVLCVYDMEYAVLISNFELVTLMAYAENECELRHAANGRSYMIVCLATEATELDEIARLVHRVIPDVVTGVLSLHENWWVLIAGVHFHG